MTDPIMDAEHAGSAGLAIAAGVELAKLALQIYFLALQTSGKTEEEMDKIYQELKVYFLMNPPTTLPDME